MDNGDGTISVHFGAVESDDEYFYYVADKEHNIGAISLDNVVTFTKPTTQDGINYTFRAYAVDFNGNMSDNKEYAIQMPFDANINLALNKPATCGYHQNDNVASRANNDNLNDFWTSFGGEADNAWWQVDLGNMYVVNKVRILFNDIVGVYNILYSIDATEWFFYQSDFTATNDTKDQTFSKVANARYMKFTSTSANVGIKEFEVYATGFAATDNIKPVISTFEVDAVDVTSVTFRIAATDVDDNGTPQIVTYKISGDNDFVTVDVVPDANGLVTVNGLTKHTTYHFTLTATDPSGNYTQSAPLETRVAFDPTVNLALTATATHGCAEGEHTADKAIDNNEGTYWGTYGCNNWETSNVLTLDLNQVYTINLVKIISDGTQGAGQIVTLYYSDDAINWLPLKSNIDIPDHTTTNIAVVASTQYIQLRATKDNMVAIKEIEVYGSDYEDTQAPIVIDENTDPTTLTNGAVCNVKFAREMTVANGIWNTIALPFSMTANQIANTFGAGTRVAKLQSTSTVASQNAINLVFAYVNEINAGTPYIILPTETGNGAIIENVTINTTENPVVIAGQVTMHPVLKTISYNYGNGDPIKFFLATDGNLHYNEASNSIKALRAYFTFDNVTSIAAAAQVRARVVFNENVETGMDNLINENAPLKVIENGQLIIIRGGVKYNVQGQKL